MTGPPVGVAIVGCGYVFDHYLSSWGRHPELRVRGVFDVDPVRVAAVTDAYDLHGYPSLAALLDDAAVEIVVNLTSIRAHHDITRAALSAGKHVYTEKPVAEHLEQARELFDLAAEKGLHLAAAPSNALSPTIQTMWRAVLDGAIGQPRVVYAEFDDNPVHLMHPETWRSRTGAPWPYRHEYEHGSTVEHAGYHLTWLCAMFGPVASVTALSKQVILDKTDVPLDPPDTPDFSVACLNFASGVVARLTFSIAAPLDHRMRIVGERGVLSAETYRDYECPVHLEPFSDLTLNARKARSIRSSRSLRWLFGVDGHRLPLVPPPFGEESTDDRTNRAPLDRLRDRLRELKRRETGVQDKAMGIAELADAIEQQRTPFPPPDLTLHVTELTYAIQRAGPNGDARPLQTTLRPVSPAASTLAAAPNDRPPLRTRVLDALLRRLLRRMHQH
jgi:predicted dehydrogenase